MHIKDCILKNAIFSNTQRYHNMFNYCLGQGGLYSLGILRGARDMRPRGFRHTKVTKARIQASLKGLTKTPEHRNKIAVSVSRARREAIEKAREPKS